MWNKRPTNYAFTLQLIHKLYRMHLKMKEMCFEFDIILFVILQLEKRLIASVVRKLSTTKLTLSVKKRLFLLVSVDVLKCLNDSTLKVIYCRMFPLFYQEKSSRCQFKLSIIFHRISNQNCSSSHKLLYQHF